MFNLNRITLIGVLSLLLGSAFAQTPTPIRSVTSLPATCNGGTPGVSSDEVILITVGVGASYLCTAPNTWTAQAGGATPFNVITPGSNTGALTMGTGGSLTPVNLGQIAGAQVWLPGGLLDPTGVGVLTGGGLDHGHTIAIAYTFISAAGETNPSRTISAGISSPTWGAVCISGSICSFVFTAPTIPTGYTGYTAYFCDINGGAGCTVPAKVLACVNILTNCTITNPALNSGIALPTINTAIPQPPNVQASLCPPSVIPSLFVGDTNGNFQTQGGVDPFFDNVNGPPGPGGALVFCRRVQFNDTLLSPPFGKNAFVNIRHRYPTGTSAANQDRGLSLVSDTAITDASAHFGLEGVQSEVDMNGSFSINGSPDSEVAAGSFQTADFTKVAQAAPNFGITGVRISLSRQPPTDGSTSGAGWGSYFALNSNVFDSGNLQVNGGTIFAALRAAWSSTSGFANNKAGIGLLLVPPATGTAFNNGSIGINGQNTGFVPNNAVDFLIRNDVDAWDSDLNDTIWINGTKQSDPGGIIISASEKITGAVTVSQVGTPTPSNPSCTGGATLYSYVFVFKDAAGGTVTSGTLNTPTTCVNPLTGGNPATFFPVLPIGFTGIDVYRTAGPMSTGKIGSVTCTQTNLRNVGCSTFLDTGLAGDGTTAPASNTTGGIKAFNYRTTTLCAAIGSSANPSVAACSAAAAGAFSCATNASTGTCTVNTTAVTANSSIVITPSAADGTRLGVTCNTTADVPTAPRLAAISTGVSFTINLGTVAVNPTCYEYSIVN